MTTTICQSIYISTNPSKFDYNVFYVVVSESVLCMHWTLILLIYEINYFPFKNLFSKIHFNQIEDKLGPLSYPSSFVFEITFICGVIWQIINLYHSIYINLMCEITMVDGNFSTHTTFLSSALLGDHLILSRFIINFR